MLDAAETVVKAAKQPRPAPVKDKTPEVETPIEEKPEEETPIEETLPEEGEIQ